MGFLYLPAQVVWKRSCILVVVFDEPAKYYNELLLITLTIIADEKCVVCCSLLSPSSLSLAQPPAGARFVAMRLRSAGRTPDRAKTAAAAD
jgi:hypothetical protein